MRYLFYFITLLFFVQSCVPVSNPSSSSPILYFADRDYIPSVGNVIVTSGMLSGVYQNPVTSIGRQNLSLSFDLLESEFQYLNIKIYHCTTDWQKSGLADLEFMKEFNEIPINQYSFSQAIYSTYVAYQITLPEVTKSGNFVVAVYRDNASKDLVLTRRFVVYNSKAAVNAEIVLSSGIEERRTHHQIELDVRYGGLNIINPNRDIRVVLLQNHNWNLAMVDLLPTNIRVDQQLLEFRQFDVSNNFAAGNDFRLFDISTLAAKGQQIERIGIQNNQAVALIETQKSRGLQAFSEPLMSDLNGKYYLRNRNPFERDDQSEYVDAVFQLESAPLDREVYIVGQFNNWQMNASNLMRYDETRKQYIGNFKLKQGYYNYQFWTNDPEPMRHFEGSHMQTKNEYEVLVYYREPGTIYDQVVGYSFF